ncbi:MAG: hypothetical protein EHM64_12270, partial [Ignavibacteriae bacterium]
MNALFRYSLFAGVTCIWLTSVSSQPARLQFRHLTPDDGLSSSTVTCILQDHQGFMWIGTYYGLNRYDGQTFKVYNDHSADPTSLPHKLIWALYEDHEKNLLIGTSAGLSAYNWKKDNFFNYMQEKSSALSEFKFNVLNIIEDSIGNLWLATGQGLIYFDRKNNKAARYTMDPHDPKSLSYYNVENVFIDSKKNMWVSTRKGLNLFHPEDGTFQHVTCSQNEGPDMSEVFFTDIVEDKEGFIWVGSYGGGLFRITNLGKYRYSIKNYRHIPNDRNSLSTDRIHSLFVDTHGEVWIGTENGGLNIYFRDTESFWCYRNDELDPNSLNNESVNSIYEDNTGNYWIGTFTGGVNISKNNSNAIMDFRNLPGVPTSLSRNSVTSFMEDHTGNIWIGTDGGGLDLFDSKTGQFSHYDTRNTNLNSNAILSLVEDSEHKIWIGTWAGGLNRFDVKTKLFQSFTTNNSNIPDNNINFIAEDKSGDLWIGSFQNGLIHYQTKKNEFINYSSKNNNISISIISAIGIAPDGRILVGTASGFNIFNPKEKYFLKYLHMPENNRSISSSGIQCFAVENDTSIWVGTNNGLNRFNPKTELFTRYFVEDGLPDNVIRGLLFDQSGNLWVSTNKGLSRFNSKEREFKNFIKSDGLQSNEFNNSSVLRLNDGRLLFGGTNGFNLIYPDRIRENKNIPRVIITDLLVFNKPVDMNAPDSPLRSHISQTEELVLSYQQSVVTFSFAAMDFTVPEKNQFAYIMEGFEKNWNYVGTKHNATYTNLDPGEYLFRVKASNNDGTWNEQGTSLRIMITPPFWKMWWFRLLGMLLLAGLLALGYKMRTARILTLNRELHRRVKERTTQLEAANKELEAFAYSVSHDLRAPLRAIYGFAHILTEDHVLSLNAASKHACEVISAETKRMGQLIEDFLSLSHSSYSNIHISTIDMQRLVHLVFHELVRGENHDRIDFHMSSLPPASGDPALIREVWVNLISNAIKFSSKRERAVIEVDYRDDGQRVIYSIQDNGVGFDMKYEHKLFGVFQRLHGEKEFDGTGVGLAIVKRLINRHGGEVWADSKLDQGA